MIINVTFKDCNQALEADLTCANDTFCASEFASYVQAHGVVEWDNILNKPSVFPPALYVDEQNEELVVGEVQ